MFVEAVQQAEATEKENARRDCSRRALFFLRVQDRMQINAPKI